MPRQASLNYGKGAIKSVYCILDFRFGEIFAEQNLQDTVSFFALGFTIWSLRHFGHVLFSLNSVRPESLFFPDEN